MTQPPNNWRPLRELIRDLQILVTPECRRRGLRDRAAHSLWDPVWDDLSMEFRGLLITCTLVLRGISEGDVVEAD